MSTSTHFHVETVLVRGAETQSERIKGAVVAPIFQSSTYEIQCEVPDNYDAVQYIRLNNTPSHGPLHAKIAALEGSEAALVTASGMAAITAVLFAFLKAGDHVLAQNVLYGGTHHFISQNLERIGVQVTFFDATRGAEQWDQLVRPNTKLLYVEGLTNPLIQMADHESLVPFAKRHKLVSVIDNTLLSPVFFAPCKFGYDVVVHSATKYYNGHSDIVAGIVASTKANIREVTSMLNHLGGSLDPHACFLLNRGMQTLSLRIRQQNSNALFLATELARHAAVKTVHYAGLPSSPYYARAYKLFTGCGGLLSFDLKAESDEEAVTRAKKVLSAVRLFASAPSLGGTESLITLPAFTSHAGMNAADRTAAGITLSLIRVAVGIEHHEDLWRDLKAALDAL